MLFFEGPASMSRELGASTLRTGTTVFSISEIMAGKGSRPGPLNEKPKIVSMIRSVDSRDWAKYPWHDGQGASTSIEKMSRDTPLYS